MEKSDCFFDRHYKKIYIILLAVTAAACLLRIGGEYVVSDEAYSFGLVRHGFSDVWRITAADVHPPLYYFLLKICIAPLSYNLAAARVVSVIPYVLISAFGGIQLKKLFSEKAACLFMFIFPLFPYGQEYAVKVRMYSLAALFVFACAVYAYKSWLDQKLSHFILYAVFGVAAAYTHYFALVSAGFIYLILLAAMILHKKRFFKKWLLSAAVTVILYLPWLKEFISQLVFKVNNEYWIEPITLRTLYEYVTDLFGSSAFFWFAWCFALIHLFLLIFVIFSKDRKTIGVCVSLLLTPVGTIALGVLASVAVRPVFIIRYVIPCIPLLAAFLAIALGRIKSRAVIAAVLILILIGGIGNYYREAKQEYSHRKNEMDHAFVREHSDCDGYVVISNATHVSRVLGYLETEKPIFSNSGATSPANPFENILPIKGMDSYGYDSLVCIISKGEEPSRKEFRGYDIKPAGNIRSNGRNLDVYLLEKNGGN